MSNKDMIRRAMWVELRQALVKDFPDVEFPFQSPPALFAVVSHYANYIAEISGPTKARTQNSN